MKQQLIFFSYFLIFFIKANAQIKNIEIEYRFTVINKEEGTQLTFFKLLKDNGNASVFFNKDTTTLGTGIIIPTDKSKNFGIYVNKVTNRLYQYAPIYSKDFYILEDSISDKFQWTIHDTVQKTILGYDCKLATCKFRGRQFNVYFCELLPFNTGPWKLTNLPGTILEASTMDGIYGFIAYKIITNSEIGEMSNPYNSNKIKFLTFSEHKKLLLKKLVDNNQKLQSQVKSSEDITYDVRDNSIELLNEQ